MLALLLVSAGWWTAPALAHSPLEEASPGPGDTVRTGATVVALTFGSDLSPTGVNSISMQGPQGVALQVGTATVVQGTMLCARTEPLPEGEITLTYRATSADGHPVQGRYTFTAAPDGAEVRAGACADARLPDLDAEPAAIDDGSGGLPGWVVPLVVALAVVAALLAGVAILRSRRS